MHAQPAPAPSCRHMSRALETSVPTVKDYLDIIHHTFEPIAKLVSGDQLLKITELDKLLLHPVAGFSFESFVIEEIIRGFQATMATQMEFTFTYYRPSCPIRHSDQQRQKNRTTI